MSSQDSENTKRLPARDTSSTDRAGWIAMAVVALLGASVLVWAASLNAG